MALTKTFSEHSEWETGLLENEEALAVVVRRTKLRRLNLERERRQAKVIDIQCLFV